jgi:esterase/lipase
MFLALLPGCMTVDTRPAIDRTHLVPAQNFRFADGKNAIFYTLDKTLSPSSTGRLRTLVFVVGGSGCDSMQYFLPHYFRGLDGDSGSLRIYMLQKRGVQDLSWGRDHGCSRDAIVDDHPAQWIADQTEFIQSRIRGNIDLDVPSPRIVIVGISEGGDIAPLLAKSIVGVSHLVIVGNAGTNPLETFRLQNRRHDVRSNVEDFSALNTTPSEPDAITNDIGGRTWRYWSELRFLEPTETLLELSIPIWIGMGSLDQSIPIEAVQYLKGQFELKNKTNLHLRLYEGADHGLATPKVSHLSDFWYDFDRSMRK